MIQIAVIGGGNHSRENHIPAIAHYAEQSPGLIELAAFCDLNPELTASLAAQYGFCRYYTDAGEMLAVEKLDGCIAITPIPVTTDIAKQVIEAGIPLLMEKPPGSTPQEAREICDLAVQTNASVMVSMNRRFDPALQAAVRWRAERPLEYVRAVMHRHNRTENDFFTGTAIHALDALRWLAGEVRDHSMKTQWVDGTWWYTVQLEFDSGARGILEVMPNCGHLAEIYEMLGSGYRLTASVGDYGSGGFCAWQDGELIEQQKPVGELAPFVRNGTYAETVEFLSALLENRLPHPTPMEVLQSVDLCHRLQQGAVD